MISRLKLALAAAGLAALMHPAAAKSPHAVVELFTSQGCSSCPAADALLTSYADRPGVIALTWPVDYWDYLGWKDTLAQPAFSDRQRAYAKARGDRQVYTPQVIVNGVRSCIGSDRDKVERSLARATEGRSELPVAVAIEERDGKAVIRVDGSGEPRGLAEVVVVPLQKTQSVTVERGENRGRTVTYINVARGLTRLGTWHGQAAQFEMPLSTARGTADGYVVLLQETDGAKLGAILGAAKSPGL